MTVARDVLALAAADPARPAVRVHRRGGDVELDRGTLAARVVGGATELRRLGVAHDALVAVDLADPLDQVVAMLAVDLAGATPLMADPGWSDGQRREVLAAVRPDHHLTAPLPSATRADHRVVEVAPAAMGWAGFSSGSTGRPRAVVRTRASWADSFAPVTALVGTTSADTVGVPGPLASSLYCFAAAHTLASGATLALAERGTSPGAVMADAGVVHTVPHGLTQLVEALDNGATSRVRTAVVGGAALPDELRQRAAALGVSVVSYYGAVELSFVAADADGRGLRPFTGVEIDVRPLPGSDLGEVWVRSPWTAEGYLSGATGPLRHDADGWSTVGDLGQVAESGALVLRGRGDGAVLTGGATVVPEDVEVVIKGVPGVVDAVVVGTPHAYLGAIVTAVVETDGRTTIRADLDAAARRGLAAAQRPRRWLAVERLPRTSSGKPARAAVGAALVTGALPARPLR